MHGVVIRIVIVWLFRLLGEEFLPLRKLLKIHSSLRPLVLAENLRQTHVVEPFLIDSHAFFKHEIPWTLLFEGDSLYAISKFQRI